MGLIKKVRAAEGARLRAENKRLKAELEAARARLERAEAGAEHELMEFVSAANHDLRAPLRHIELFSQIIIDDHAAQLPAQAVEGLGHLHSASKKLGLRLDALIKLMRQTQGPIQRATIDLGALLGQQITRVAARYPERQVRCDAPPECWVEGDEAQLALMLDCLLDNAWKFTATREAAQVLIRLERAADGWALTLQDNGVGFEQRHASRLGTPFRKLHVESQFPGPGIGLATASRIARRHGGALELSGALGVGASVTILLPTLRPRR